LTKLFKSAKPPEMAPYRWPDPSLTSMRKSALF
jgi:hypothetical protein